MDSTDYLFDPRPYRRTNVRTVPLERSPRSAIQPEVWEALVRVKVALDTRSQANPKDRRR